MCHRQSDVHLVQSLIRDQLPITGNNPMEAEIEEMLRSAPTTEDGGDLVLFEGRKQFVGQFKTGEELAACIKERNLKRPFLCMMSMLKRRSYAYLDGVLYEW